VTDPILSELRQIRANIDEECHGDLALLVKQLQERTRRRVSKQEDSSAPHPTNANTSEEHAVAPLPASDRV
jgi:hypothetical protein